MPSFSRTSPADSARLAILALAVSLCVAGPASAQYIYLDANGDGIHTLSDTLAPSGTTTVGVWLRTDQNRDGTAAVCPTEDGPLSMNAYEIVLRATNGTIQWGSIDYLVPDLTLPLPTETTPTEAHFGSAGAVYLPPGAYLLARIPLTVATGTPSISVEPYGLANGTWLTAFASPCSGLDYDNSPKLGLDWHDSDGLPYGGVVRRPPHLAPVAPIAASESFTTDVALSANDEDGDPLQFFVRGEPGFVSLATVDPGAGTALGTLHVAPGYTDAGVYDFTVGVTDGEFRDSTSATLVVAETNRPPSLGRWQHDYVVPVGESTVDLLRPSDPDGQSVRVFVVSGPAYMRVEQPSPGYADLWFRPTIHDIGSTTGTLGASDGYTTVTESFAIRVYSPPILTPLTDMSVAVDETASQPISASDPDGDVMALRLVQGPAYLLIDSEVTNPGSLTASIRVAPRQYDVGDATAIVEVSSGDGETRGSFRIHVFDPSGEASEGRPLLASTFAVFPLPATPTAAAWGDYDEDGIDDLVVACEGDNQGVWTSPGVQVLLGRRSGALEPGSWADTDRRVSSLIALDVDHDSHLDLVATVPPALLEYRGRGDGTFEAPIGIYGEANFHAVTGGDIDRDGWIDLVATVVAYPASEAVVLLNDRSGGFPNGVALADVGPYPEIPAIADFDGDGNADLLVGDFEDHSLRLWSGRGDGTFATSRVLSSDLGWPRFRLVDLDGDGDLDLAAPDLSNGDLRLYENLTGGVLQLRSSLPVGGAGGGATGMWIFDFGDVTGDGTMDVVAIRPGAAGGVVGRGTGPFQFALEPTFRSVPAPVTLRLADVNYDGRLDATLVDAGGRQVAEHLQRSAGGFDALPEVPTGGEPTAVASGDWSRDGRPDVAVSLGDRASIEFFTGQSGRLDPWTEILLPAPVSRLRTADLDADGFPELLACAAGQAGVFVLHPGSNPAYTFLPWDAPVDDFDVIDWNRDGRLDLVVLGRGIYFTTMAVLAGAPDGSLAEMTRGEGRGSRIAAGDFNGDGLEDIATLESYYGALYVTWGDGTSEFRQPYSALVEGQDASDLFATNPDPAGKQGLLVTRATSADISLYRSAENSSTMQLQATLGMWGGAGGSAMSDVNGDGIADLVTANPLGHSISVFPGYADGTFGRRQAFGTGSGPSGVAILDLDGDGRPEVLSANRGDRTIAVHRNLGNVTFNRPPAARAGGPYAGVAGSPILFDAGGSSDPDGDLLAYRWRFGDGIEGVGVTAAHSYASGGTYRVWLAVSDGRAEQSDSTTASVTAVLEARVFKATGSAPVVVGAGAPTICVSLEAKQSDFLLEEVDPASLRLVTSISGSPDSIPAITSKQSAIGDADHNGVPDLAVCFARDDIERLLRNVTGRANIPISIRGRLSNGAIVDGGMSLLVLARGGGLASYVRPHPVSRSGVIAFRLARRGTAAVRIFDARGRLVQTLLPRANLDAGYHEVPFDATGASGVRVPSGVYFYRIETDEEVESGRILIAR